MKTNERLQTTLDRLPYGDDVLTGDLKVTKTLPDGVKSSELYKDIIRIAWPSFVELLLPTNIQRVQQLFLVYVFFVS